ncbi:MAG TPA: hypothetical protein VGM17_03350 [Rhizomicrobium sp.]|jgi:uncharacterized small protein (DUF1192 family)
MKGKAGLLAGVASAALMLSGAAMAQTTTTTTTGVMKHRHHHHVIRRVTRTTGGESRTIAELERRIDALEAEVHQAEMHNGRIAETKHRHRHYAAGAEQVTTTATVEAQSEPPPAEAAEGGATNPELEQRVEALEAEVQQSEMQNAKNNDQVQTALAGITGWWNNTSISGRMYFDLSNINNKNDHVSNPQNGTHFDIKRFYVGIDHTFDDVWSANVTTDVTYDSSVGNTQIFLKKAYLQAKVFPWLTLRAGSADMPWIPFVEDVYGYRYVENTLIDRVKDGNSADWGLHASGAWGDPKDPDDVVFEYAASVVNGAGYKHPGFGLGTNRSKGMDFEGRADVKYDGFVLGVGGYSGKLGKDLGDDSTFHTAQRFDVLAAYVADGFRVGAEYFTESNWDTVSNTNSDHGHGWSGFASYQFAPEWAVFGRYDRVKPQSSVGFQPDFTNDYYNAGIEWTPTKIVNLSLVYKHDAGSDGDFTDSNGLIGGLDSGHYNEIGLFGQVRW